MKNKITRYASFRTCMNHPALDGFGQYVLPWETGILTKLIPPLPIGYLCRCLGYDAQTVVDGIRFRMNRQTQLLPLYPGQSDAGKQNTRLIYIPGDKGKPFAVVCAGGGFTSVNLMQEAFPIAQQLHQAGYPVFLLKYRVGSQPGDGAGTVDKHRRAIEDLSASLEMIRGLGLSMKDYALWGFSAGGRTITLWNENREVGRRSGSIPAPGAMMLLYPGAEATVQPDVNDVESAVYLAVGRNDKLIGEAGVRWCETFAKRLSQSGKQVLFEEFERAPHGFGLGVGTDAEGWLPRALAFWRNRSGV